MIESEKVRLLFKHRGVYYTIAQIQWRKETDGEGIFVHLPYFKEQEGVLRDFTIQGPMGTESTINFAEAGITTTEAVKYSHHSDGTAHFSQDGRIVTSIRTKTAPLSSLTGHLFTINFWNLTGFEIADSRRLPSQAERESNVCIGGEKYSREARRIGGVVIGYLYRGAVEDPSYELSEDQIVQPIVWKHGKMKRQGTILRPPASHESSLVLCIGCMRNKDRYAESKAKLAFLGGFAEDGDAADPSSSVRGIALMYGISNFETIQNSLGSSDFSKID